MNIFQSIVLGIVEGITEFLPISSTFHLIWTSTLLSISQSDFVKLFEVVIQAGAILAVVLIYFKEVLKSRELMMKIMATFLPTAAVGFVLYKFIKGFFFENLLLTTSVFIIMGIVFIVIELLVSKKKLKLEKSIDTLNLKNAAIIGLFQSLAVVPGVSRSGAVMLGMMVYGFKREEAAKYSFLVSVPTILMAALYDLYKMKDVVSFQSENTLILIIGIVVSFVSAYVGVRWLISFLQKNSLAFFGWYRVVLGIILLLFLLR